MEKRFSIALSSGELLSANLYNSGTEKKHSRSFPSISG